MVPEDTVERILEGSTVVFLHIPVRGPDHLSILLLIRIGDGIPGSRVDGILDEPLKGKGRRIRVGHELITEGKRLLFAEILDHVKGVEHHSADTEMLHFQLFKVQIRAVVGGNDDPRVLIHPLLPEGIHPVPEEQQRGHVCLICLPLHLGRKGHGAVVSRHPRRMLRVISRVVHILGGLIGRLLQLHGLVGEAVNHDQELVLSRLPDLRHVFKVLQEGILGHEEGILKAELFFGFIVIAAVVQHRMDHHGGDAQEAIAEHIPITDGIAAFAAEGRVIENPALGDEGPDVRDVIENAEIRDPLVIGQGRIADGDLKAGIVEEEGHQAQGLIVLVHQELLRTGVDFIHGVLIAAEEGGGAGIGAVAVGQGVRIAGEARELLLQLRFFLEDEGREVSDGPVQHDDHHVFAGFVQMDDLILALLRLVRQTPDFRQAGGNGDHVHRGHAEGDQAGQGRDRPENDGFFLPEEENRAAEGQDHAEVDQLLRGFEGLGDIPVIDQDRGHIAVIVAEEHIVHEGCDRQGAEDQRIKRAALPIGKQIINHTPEKERAGSQEEGAEHKGQRVPEGIHLHELRRGGVDHRRGDQQTGQDRQEDYRSEESPAEMPVFRLCRFFCLFRRFALSEELFEDIFQERKDIVQRPVEDQAGRGIIQQDQEDQRHAVKLDFAFQGHAAGIDHTGDDIDQGHEDREDVDGHTADFQHPVQGGQIGNRPEGDPLQNGQVRQEVIGRHEERDLEQEGQGAPQDIIRLIIVLAVEGLEHHEALIAGEGFPDLIDPGLQALRDFLLLPLEGIGLFIQRQDEDVDRDTEDNDRENRAALRLHGQGEDHIEQQLDGPQYQFMQNIYYGHFSSSGGLSGLVLHDAILLRSYLLLRLSFESFPQALSITTPFTSRRLSSGSI